MGNERIDELVILIRQDSLQLIDDRLQVGWNGCRAVCLIRSEQYENREFCVSTRRWNIEPFNGVFDSGHDFLRRSDREHSQTAAGNTDIASKHRQRPLQLIWFDKLDLKNFCFPLTLLLILARAFGEFQTIALTITLLRRRVLRKSCRTH